MRFGSNKNSLRGPVGLIPAVLMLVLILGCGSALAGEKVLKVGANLPFSGPAGTWGRALTDAILAAADIYNSKGGINIGGQKYKIMVVEADNKFTPEGSVTATRRLLEVDKANWISGGLFKFDTLAMQEITEPAKILSISTGAGLDVISASKGKKYSFRSWIEYYEIIPGLLKWLHKKHPDLKKVAILDPNTDSCWEGQDIVKKEAPPLGFELVYKEFYDPATTDFYPFLVKLMATKPDVFFSTSGPPQQLALIYKGLRELGFKGLIVSAVTNDAPAMATVVDKKFLEGAVSPGTALSGPMAPEALKKWAADFEKKYGNAQTALIHAPAVHAIFQAYEAAGSLDPDKVVAVLESGREWKTFTGITGKFGAEKRYGQAHQWLAPQNVLSIKDGVSSPIDVIPPEDMI